MGDSVSWWLRCYAISLKVSGSIPNVTEFFPMYLIFSVALGPVVYRSSSINEYQKQKKMFLGSKVRPVLRDVNFTAICEPIV
jgi:hypothetical protein